MNKLSKIIIGISALLVVSGAVGVIYGIQKQVDAKSVHSKKVTKSSVIDQQKHSVPLEEIVSGGPPQDGIPSIDKPQFVSVDQSTFLTEEDVGIAVSRDGIDRFYPFQILVWHEIVNDSIKGKRILITYCPLCYSGIVFDPLVKGERVEFGTSGKLWNSNLVMYDRKTQSLWSQVLGKAIKGEMTDTELSVLPSDIVRFGAWKKKHPQGEVLSKETGQVRRYGTDPYSGYATSPNLYFPVKTQDVRLNKKELVAGVIIGSKKKAYPVSVIKKKKKITDSLGGREIMITYDPESESIRILETKKKKNSVIAPVYAYWFSWVSAHPDTDVYK